MPDATITTYQDGPLIVRGDVQILSEDGEPLEAGRTTVALCRCGKSTAKPFCDGTHALARFRAPGGATPIRPPRT